MPYDACADATYYVTFTVTEPLLLSPFLFANPKTNDQGIYGVQNIWLIQVESGDIIIILLLLLLIQLDLLVFKLLNYHSTFFPYIQVIEFQADV